jgi:hypothetical protein
MARTTVELSPERRAISFPNGTVLESAAGYGSATQFTSSRAGLRSAELPSEIDTSPLFDRALAETGISEQETIHLEAPPPAGLRSAADDTIVVRPAIPPGDTNPRVVLYEDDSGGLSWHFADGAMLTNEERDRQERRGLLRDSASSTFTIPARTVASRESLLSGVPRGALRGFITKIGRKVLKVLIIPVAGTVLEKPVQALAGAIESRVRCNRIWKLTADNYNRGSQEDFKDWNELNGKRALLVVHGILSSVEGMLSQLPRSAMERWVQQYEGRVIAFNHLSVTLSPEDNARYFLEAANKAGGKFEFDILCHSRGGVVSRTMAERALNVVDACNSSIRRIYFVASPNQGSALGDPEHMVDMLDVFTNLLTEFPDGQVLYAIETILGIVKLLTYTTEESLPGVQSMGTKGYIADQLNKATTKSPANYGAAASDYSPAPGVDNGFFTGRFVTYIMKQIFERDGNPVANDLVVPRDGVYAANGHPSFPILSPLLYEAREGVWHSGFFAQPKTIAHIEKHFGIGNEMLVVGRDQSVAEVAAEVRRGGLRGGDIMGGNGGAGSAREPASVVEREPSILFHELMMEGETSDLVVRLSDVLKARELSQAIQIMFAEGQEQIPIKVDLSAPGFEIVGGVRSARMTIKKKRDPETEEVRFQLTAKSPGEKPTTCKIIAAFFQGNDCLGAVTHWTNVIPKNFAGPRTGAGGRKADPVRISSAPRESVDLIIFVREIEAQPDSYEIALQSNILGEEYALRDMGTLKLAGTEFSNFFSRTIDPQFQQFPSDPRLTDEEFDKALAAWSASFLVELESLGRRLWGYLPPRFRDEYVRLRCLSSPPRSICVYSDEMVLPWELIRPSGMVDGHFKEFEPLGIAHVLGRWKPDLGARPQPQAVNVEKMVVLTPKYGTSPLYWAAKESVELKKVISGMTQLAAVDRKAFEDLLNSTGVQLVHFNGHGVWDSMGDLSALRLENNESIPAMAFSSRKLGMESHPILYLNACSVGRGAANVGRPGGFAASCLDGGWSGVIAPYWRVYDPYAMQFCLELYGKLILGYSVGEALQQIRRDRPNDYTAQSYSYFGDPGARMLFQ